MILTVLPFSLAAAESQDEKVKAEYFPWQNPVPWMGSPFALRSAIGTQARVTYQVALLTDPYYRDPTVSGDFSLNLGSRTTLSGNDAVVVGTDVTLVGDASTAIGAHTHIKGSFSQALGTGAYVDGESALAIGSGTRVEGNGGLAIGRFATVSTAGGVAAIAFGYKAKAGTPGWTGAIALGGESKAAQDSIAVGYEASTNAEGALAIGRGANAASQHSAALGKNAKSTGSGAMSVGGSAVAKGDYAMAFGYEANANSTHTTAMGSRTNVTGIGATAFGNSAYVNGRNGIAIGSGSNATTGSREGAIAIGGDAKAGSTSWDGAIALGSKAVASHDSVAIGYGASTTASSSIALGRGSVASEANSVSVGNGTTKRRIVNVADARLSTSSTDAVTGKQLHATNQKIGSAEASLGVLNGLISQTSSDSAVRLGGANTSLTLDVRNKNSANRRISGLADGALSGSSTEAVNGKQLNATNVAMAAVKSTADNAQNRVAVLDGLLSQTSASGAMRLGGNNTGTIIDVANKSGTRRKVQNLANGVLSSTSTDAVTGQQLNATNSEVASVRTAATAAKTAADAARGVADGAVQKADALGGLVGQASASGNVRLGAENAGTILDVSNKTGAKRRIYNIANGTLSTGSTDAVTGQQLFATNTLVETQRQALTGHAQQLVDQDGRIADNRVDLDALRADFDNFDPDLDGVVKFSADRLLVDMEGARVSGVAAGDISSAASTDAVNGGQLFSTNEKIAALEMAGGFVSVGAGGDQKASSAGLGSVAIGDSAQATPDGEGGVALGAYARAIGKNSISIGRAAFVAKDAEGGFALGVGTSVNASQGMALGAESRVQAGAHNAVAIGYGSIASQPDTVSFGNDNVQRRLTGISRGTGEYDAAAIVQLAESLSALGGGAGLDSYGGVNNPIYNVQGGTQTNVGDALAALDGAVIRSDSRVDGLEGQLRATFQQSHSTRADGVGQLNLAGAQGMVLSNLADGRIAAGSRDAVTGNQLYAAEQKISQNRNDLEAMRREREMGEAAMRGRDASVIDYGGARLTGVAEAKLSADSSDVVRGSQLFRTNEVVASLADRFNNVIVDHDDLSTPAEAAFLSVAVGGDTRALGEGSTSVGSYAASRGKQSTAIGYGAHIAADALTGVSLGQAAGVFADWGVALGSYSRVTVGARFAVAVGAQSIAESEMEASFGNTSLKRRLTNIANGTANHNAATIGQLRGALSTLGGNIDANGNVTTSGFNVQGQHQSTINDALTTLDSAVVTTGSRMDRVETQLRSVFEETPSTRSDGTAQLTLAGANGMVISNVANGLIAAGSREAVNGGQLHAVQQQLNGRMDGLEQRVDGQPQSRALATASAVPTEQVTPTPETSDSPQVASAGEGTSPTPQPKSKQDDTPSPTPQVDTAELEKMLARANEYTDGAISNFERRLDKMDKRFNRMAAMSSAQTAMAMNTAGLATYNRLGAGVGYAEGESAMAVGYQRVLNEKGSATFSLNGAFTNSGERSMGVGVGIGW